MNQQPETTELWRSGALGKSASGGPQIIFAQVREDAENELRVLNSLGEGRNAFCIGSGGCTAFSLLAARPSQLHVIDINPAQIRLIELKRAALQRLSYSELKSFLCESAEPFYKKLRESLSEDAASFWDSHQVLMRTGLNQCGEIEHKLKRAMKLFRIFIHSQGRIESALTQPTLVAQRQFYEEQWNSWRWRTALKIGLSRSALRLAYGKQFVDSLPEDFADVIRQSLAHTFLNFPAQDNGYLWQTFLGRYPANENALPIYLQPERWKEVKMYAEKMNPETADAAEWLQLREARSINFFALSNILEVTSAGYAEKLAEAVGHAAQSGALICLRWILPPPRNITELLDARWRFEKDLSQELSDQDRSLFCKFIRVYRV